MKYIKKSGYIIGLITAMSILTFGQASEDFAELRRKMVAEIEADVKLTNSYTGISRLSADVIEAMEKVPRHEFVPDRLKSVAYANRPLPIGYNQTISQPYIVALMTELAEVNHSSIVLEVGTGSGYQAAVLGEIVNHVYTIEIIEALGERAMGDLKRLGYNNVTVKVGDGYHGWIEHSPFDAILVTAAPEEVPQPLIDQLKDRGKLVIPVGEQGSTQSLVVLEKDFEGNIRKKNVLPVGFVPLTREKN